MLCMCVALYLNVVKATFLPWWIRLTHALTDNGHLGAQYVSSNRSNDPASSYQTVNRPPVPRLALNIYMQLMCPDSSLVCSLTPLPAFYPSDLGPPGTSVRSYPVVLP